MSDNIDENIAALRELVYDYIIELEYCNAPYFSLPVPLSEL